MNAANHYATPAIGLVAVGVQERAEDILVPPLLRNCLTLNYISTVYATLKMSMMMMMMMTMVTANNTTTLDCVVLDDIQQFMH